MVPSLGLAAHGLAAGQMPTATGCVAVFAMGIILGLVASLSRSRWLLLITLSAGQGVSHLLLMGADHHAMSTRSNSTHIQTPMGARPLEGAHHMSGHHHMPAPTPHDAMPGARPGSIWSMLTEHAAALAHPASAGGLTMLTTHVIAIPLCAAVIMLAAAVTAMATSVVCALSSAPATLTPIYGARSPRGRERSMPRIDRAAGAGLRGPPRLRMC